MKNIFESTEEEKNRIIDLHRLGVINEQLKVVPEAEGTKKDPILHIPKVDEAEEGKYYYNTDTRDLYLFTDGKYSLVEKENMMTKIDLPQIKIEDVSFNRLDELGTKAWSALGNVYTDFRIPNEFKFIGPDGKKWAVSKEWVWQELNVDDQPKFAAEPNGKPTNEFRNAFDNRQELN